MAAVSIRRITSPVLARRPKLVDTDPIALVTTENKLGERQPKLPLMTWSCGVCGVDVTTEELFSGAAHLTRISGNSDYGYEPFHERCQGNPACNDSETCHECGSDHPLIEFCDVAARSHGKEVGYYHRSCLIPPAKANEQTHIELTPGLAREVIEALFASGHSELAGEVCRAKYDAKRRAAL